MGLEQQAYDKLLEEFVAAKDLDVIYVATPHNLHYQGVMLALNEASNVLGREAYSSQSWPDRRNGRAWLAEKSSFSLNALDVLPPKIRFASPTAGNQSHW